MKVQISIGRAALPRRRDLKQAAQQRGPTV